MFLWELRTLNVVQTPQQVIMLSPFYGNYRVIWTDGRQVPRDPDLRYNGYSVGKWVDDYTFVVETTGINPKTWLDHAGRPHSDQLVVEETYHRVDHDTIELTMKITDPKMYTEPWLALNKLPLHLLPSRFRHSGTALLSERVRGVQQAGREPCPSRLFQEIAELMRVTGPAGSQAVRRRKRGCGTHSNTPDG